MLDRSHIGRDNGERFVDVEQSQLTLFCQAIGETDPVFLDKAAAQAAGHPAVPVPPTYAATLDYLAPQNEDLVIDVLQADLGRLLHGEQQFEMLAPIHVGDRLKLVKRIADIYDKKGGALEFVVLETNYTNQHGQLCARVRSVAVLRN